jgi:hypothetical protein
MKLDLHCHTYYSDGNCSPQDVIKRALDNGVTHLAITDHDYALDVDGLDSSAGLSLIPGVEISCHWQTLEIHVVGLFVDVAETRLQQMLLDQQAARRTRVEAIDEKLASLGIEGLLAYLDALPCVAYTRSHVASFLVQTGAVKTRQKAFKQYLAKGGKAYVAGAWCDLSEAVQGIAGAGGIPVLAHPGRYPLNKRRLAELVGAFADAGGAALEARYPNIAVPMMRQLESLAESHRLHVSMGSDFHDPGAHWTDIGKFPPLRGEAEALSVVNHQRWRN